MKSKNIPADIRTKSVEEAQEEIKEIIDNLENKSVNLEESMDKYNRMLHLNYHIQELFRKKAKEIKKSNLHKNKKKLIKNS